jgi:hypothetical protein
MLWSIPWDQLAGSRTGGSPSRLDVPSNRMVGSGDSEPAIIVQIWRNNLNMDPSPAVVGYEALAAPTSGSRTSTWVS